MNKKQFFTYNNQGSIDDVKKRIKNHPFSFIGYFDSLYEIFEKIEAELGCKNIRLKYYAYDSRLEKNIYMITSDRGENKNCFTCFLIDERDKSKGKIYDF